MTINEMLSGASPLEQLQILADQMERLKAQRSQQVETPIGERMETVDLDGLATKYGVRWQTLRKDIETTMGEGTVFRVGKRWVLRQVTFAEFLEKRERGE